RRMIRRFGLLLSILAVGMFSRFGFAEEMPGYGATLVERIVTLGSPQPAMQDPFLPPVQGIQPVQALGAPSTSLEGNYIARRIDELPPPMDQGLPLPSYHKIDRLQGGKPNPFTLDYVFIGRAGVDAPATNMKMSEVGLLY